MFVLCKNRAEQRQRGLGPKPSLTIYCFHFDVFINLQITLFVQFAQASLWIILVVSHTSWNECISSSYRLPAKYVRMEEVCTGSGYTSHA